MTKIIYFITPKSLIKIGTKAVEFIPVLGPALDFNKRAKKLTEMTDPVVDSSQGIGILFNYCFGKVGALSVECTLWITCSVVGGITATPTLIAAGAQFGSMVLDEILD